MSHGECSVVIDCGVMCRAGPLGGAVRAGAPRARARRRQAADAALRRPRVPRRARHRAPGAHPGGC